MTTFKEPMLPSRARQKAGLKSDTDRLPKKKRKVEKPFVIQKRYTGPTPFFQQVGNWSTHGKYETAELADSNLKKAIRKHEDYCRENWEFRVIDKRKQEAE